MRRVYDAGAFRTPISLQTKEKLNMRKTILLLATLLALSFAAFAQEHYTEGPLWRVQLIRVKPNKMDAYLTSMRESTKPLLEEQKKQGSIVDYKVFLKET